MQKVIITKHLKAAIPLLRDHILIKASHMRFDSFFFIVMSYLPPVLYIPVYPYYLKTVSWEFQATDRKKRLIDFLSSDLLAVSFK